MKWLQEYQWLVYSPKWNGGFCLPCVLFAPENSKLGQLYREPLLNFTRFKSACDRHWEYPAHKNSLVKYDAFMASLEKQRRGGGDIVQQLLVCSGEQSAENMEKLKGLVSTVVFCGKQNIPLRGHRHEDFIPGRSQCRPSNPGYFLSLMEFRANAGDKSVPRSFHMKKSGGHEVSYTSPQIQNELIKCCGDSIRDKVLMDVRNSPFFTVLADEATDAANREQMSIVLRYLAQTFQLLGLSWRDGCPPVSLLPQVTYHSL